MTAYDDKEYNEWLKHKGELDPEDQRYDWHLSKKVRFLNAVLATVGITGLIGIPLAVLWALGKIFHVF